MSRRSPLGELDSDFAEELAKLPPTLEPDPPGDLELTRERFNAVLVPLVMEAYQPRLPDRRKYQVQEYKIPVEGGRIKARCIIPVAEDESTFPLLVWFHAGGWMGGTLDLDDYHLRIVATELQISILNVDYRLAPENPFPIGLNDSFAAVKWAASQAPSLQASLSKGFIIGGSSTGSNFAAVIAHKARDDAFFADKPITGQFLQFPIVLHPDAYPEEFKPELMSMRKNADAPFLGRQQIYNIYTYVGVLRLQEPSDPEISPLLSASHEGLPPVYLQVCGLDPMRDEGLLYEKLLRKNNVPTKLALYPGLPHGFQMFYPDLPASKRLDEDFITGLQWLLNCATS
ncbi:hypothetical protein ONZ45_g5911 [Pleurotus djamor]|nr:hypothetical protein ONZ45_g5911 [Pleurotus djamor]